MSTNNNLAQRYYQILISYAHADFAANSLFQNLKKFGKEFNFKFLLDKENLLPVQNWLEVIPNVIKASKYFILLLSKKTIEKIDMHKKKYREKGRTLMKLRVQV
jgi:hypothetical protein